MSLKNYFSFFENKNIYFKLYFALIVFISVIIVFVDAISIFTILPILSISIKKDYSNTNNGFTDYVPDWIFSFQEGIDLNFFFIILILILFFRNLFHLLNNYIIYRFAQFIEVDTSKKCFFLILKKEYLEFYNQPSSELIKDLRDSVTAYSLFIDKVSRIISDLIIFILFTVILFYISFQETVFIFLYFITIFLIFSRTISKISQNKGKKSNTSAEKINLTIINTYKNFAQIILRKLKKKYLDLYTKNIIEFSNSKLIISFLRSNTKQFLEIFVLVFVLIIFFFFESAKSYNEEKLFALITIYIVAAYRMLPTVNNLVSSFIRLKNLEFAYNIIDKNIKLFNIKYKKIIFENKKNKVLNFSNSFKLKNIKFKFHDKKNYLFSDLTLEVKKNEMIGIIGPSGEGKSTLIKIILGLINIKKGKIYIDNKIVLKRNFEKYQSLFGYLPQQNLFIADTIKNNVAFGAEEIDEKKVIESLKKTNCYEFVKKLKNNIESKLDEDGKNFSTGQLQRFALARTIYFDNDIIILDEPTSALDFRAERKFIDLLRNLKGQKTIIIISHKKNTLKNCDKIFVLKNKKLFKVN